MEWLTKNVVDHLKLISRKRVDIWLNDYPFYKCGTRAYQCTKYERIRILSCVRDFFEHYCGRKICKTFSCFRAAKFVSVTNVSRAAKLGNICLRNNVS